MAITPPRTPSGFSEYLPQEQIEFNRLLDIIRRTYERYGFAPLDTPDLELSEVLLAKTGGETAQQIYRFEHGRNDLSLRHDLTVPLARYVAEHEGQLVFPFRRYQIGKVHRAERAQAGRFREFYQCDIDVIGSDSPLVDAEFPAVINEIFSAFEIGEFTIRLNDRRILGGFIDHLGARDRIVEVLRVIDKFEKLPEAAIREELSGLELTDLAVDRLIEFISLEGDNDTILRQIQNTVTTSGVGTAFVAGVENLKRIVAALRVMGVPETRFKIDLRIARGLDYYTGTVYETILNDHPELGSICSGGRYDDLASSYTKSKLPGVGISIGLSRLFYGLRAHGLVTAERLSPARVVILPLEAAQFEPALAAASALRATGHNALTYTEPNGLKQKLRYADRMGFDWAVIIGESEAAAGNVSLKNLRDGTSATIAMTELTTRLTGDNGS